MICCSKDKNRIPKTIMMTVTIFRMKELLMIMIKSYVVAAVGKIFITCSGCNRTFSAYSGVVKCKSCLAQDRVDSQHQVEDGNIF